MSIIKKFTYFLITIALGLNIYIYTYPSITPNQCSWSFQKEIIPFSENEYLTKLKSIPYFGDLIKQFFLKPQFKSSKIEDIKMLAFGDPQIKGNWPSTPILKRLDTYGNDYYLGHVYNVMKKRLNPTHVAVLGDLFSSQWIGDSEFFNRTKRYVTRLYDQPDKHREYVLNFISENDAVDWMKFLEDKKSIKTTDLKFGYENVYDWNTPNYEKFFVNEPLFLNVSGNHDIGYSGDATWQHMARYFKLFGKDNFWIEYNKGTPYAYRIVVLNSLLLEGPALQPEFLEYTWEFLYQLFERKFKGSTILLTHIPFYKKEGICVDGPKFDYYKEDAKEQYKIGLLRSQNHLSYETTQRVLNLIFDDDDSQGIILTGHDHEGCETYYNKNSSTAEWTASKSRIGADVNVKEITVRAMMGEYGGNSGLMTGHFNTSNEKWEFKFTLCPFIVQHVWWVTKIVSIISALLFSTVFIFDL